MAYRSVLTAALLLSAASSVASTSIQSVPPGYQKVTLEHGVPAESLYSLALAESSRKLPSGTRPWPWTINVAGKGYRYESRQAAWPALQQFMKCPPMKRIDVGIEQVNLGWNGYRFSSTWDAFDPYINLNAAARIPRNRREVSDATSKHNCTASTRSATEMKRLSVQYVMAMAVEAVRHATGFAVFQSGNGIHRHCFLLALTRRGA